MTWLEKLLTNYGLHNYAKLCKHMFVYVLDITTSLTYYWFMNELKEIRIATNLNQEQFAEKFEIPVRTLANWEQGYRKPPEYVVKMIKKILRYEGFTIEY